MKSTYHRNFSAMNTRCEVVFTDLKDSLAAHVFHDIQQEIMRLDNRLSRFNPFSTVSYINQIAGHESIAIDDEIWIILKKCDEYYHKTMGVFDVSVLPLVEFWNDDNVNESNFSDALLEKVGMNKIGFNEDELSVSFSNHGMGIDLGGFGKGYALENIKNILTNNKIETAFISFGESSILAWGTHPLGDCWKIGIPDRYHPDRTVYEFELYNQTLSTSGIFKNNKKSKHVINPQTGLPVEGDRTISVVAESPLDSEVLSTALLVNNNQMKDILKNFPDCRAVEIKYNKSGQHQLSIL